MNRSRTGQGYVYYRDRARGNDSTVYEHQLLDLLDHDPRDVFDPDLDVHHEAPGPDVNVPNGVVGRTYLSLVDRVEHRSNGGDCYAESVETLSP